MVSSHLISHPHVPPLWRFFNKHDQKMFSMEDTIFVGVVIPNYCLNSSKKEPSRIPSTDLP